MGPLVGGYCPSDTSSSFFSPSLQMGAGDAAGGAGAEPRDGGGRAAGRAGKTSARWRIHRGAWCETRDLDGLHTFHSPLPSFLGPTLRRAGSDLCRARRHPQKRGHDPGAAARHYEDRLYDRPGLALCLSGRVPAEPAEPVAGAAARRSFMLEIDTKKCDIRIDDFFSLVCFFSLFF